MYRGLQAIVDEEDYAYLAQFKWHGSTRKKNQVYAEATISNTPIVLLRMHRVVAGAKPGETVDHINGDCLDNRRANLRICSHQQNMWNRRNSESGTSKFKGVSWDKSNRKWRSHIRKNNKTIFLGRFLDEVEAARAYDAAAIEHFGEFARLNFPAEVVD